MFGGSKKQKHLPICPCKRTLIFHPCCCLLFIGRRVCVSQEKVRQLFDRNVVGKTSSISQQRWEIIGAK
jgi:hypothetical protein